MNKELRKMKKAVNKYVILLAENPEDAKRNYEAYISDVKMLQDAVESYIDKTADIFQVWCDTSVKVFDSDESNIFLRLERSLYMAIVNHYLNKFSYELSVAGILKDNLDFISRRFAQYENLLYL